MLERLNLEEGWSTLILVWSLIAVTAIAIVVRELTDEGLQSLMMVGTGGVVAGLLLAKSNFSARRAHVFSMVYGLALVVYSVGHLLPGDLTWRMRIFELVQRQMVWVGKAVDGGISRDSLIFIVQTSVIFWLLGYTAAWYTFRELRVWRVVLPTGLVLLSVVYYYFGPKPLFIFLAIYALLALLYISRTHLVDRERSWRSGSVRYEGDIRFDFIRASFIVGVLALLLAGNLPALGASAEVSTALSEVDQPWREFQDSWTRLFSSLRSYGTGTNDAYVDSMVLGGPRSVGNAPIMDIYVPYRLSSVYWQGVVLDTYSGNGAWSNSTDRTLTHMPDEGELLVPDYPARQVITQTVVNYIPNSSTIYAAADVTYVDQQLLLDVTEGENDEPSYNWVRARYVMRQGDQYRAVSELSTADQGSLRAASTEYPQWIRDIYLQLPDSITPQTIELAEQLTAPYENPFDKAIAVRDYLRREIAYNDQIEAPPDDVEPVHYVLFEGKEAYCTYYATAMAVMMRSQGIPARIVNGYAQGEWIDEANVYRVRANNAHTWVEVYFPEYGWIQFEPTASIPVVERPEGEEGGNPGDAFGFNMPDGPGEEALPPGALDPFGPGSDPDRLRDLLQGGGDPVALEAQQRRERTARALGGGLLLLLAGGLVTVANRFNHRVESDVDRSYGRLASWARWLGIDFRPVDTPYERADRLSHEVPEGRTPIRNLTHEYVLRRFSAAHDGDDAFDPAEEWQSLRPLLLRESVKRRLHGLRRLRLSRFRLFRRW
ncbi:MAG TPA: transglutaminase-like domain-containing protein [Candidatus Sulfomarinibacteraceae bacterium]|nr:transglutaminase-like domain-containing protein [Candidatus Sulfomarinibacteraceae bacterium]